MAKHAATQGAAPKSSTALIESAEILVKHAAAQLAVATFNANNHQVPKVQPDGTVTHCTIRDAQPAPTVTKSKGLLPLRVSPPLPASAAAASATGEVVATSSDSSSSLHLTARLAKGRRLRRARKQVEEEQATALSAVLQAPRRNKREEAVDTYRRQQLATLLRPETTERSSDDFGEFLKLTEEGDCTAEASPAPPCEPLPASDPLLPDCVPLFSTSFVVSNDFRYSRQRPTRGSSSCTASSSATAVLALVGAPAAKSRGGSTWGQPH